MYVTVNAIALKEVLIALTKSPDLSNAIPRSEILNANPVDILMDNWRTAMKDCKEEINNEKL